MSRVLLALKFPPPKFKWTKSFFFGSKRFSTCSFLKLQHSIWVRQKVWTFGHCSSGWASDEHRSVLITVIWLQSSSYSKGLWNVVWRTSVVLPCLSSFKLQSSLSKCTYTGHKRLLVNILNWKSILFFCTWNLLSRTFWPLPAHQQKNLNRACH